MINRALLAIFCFIAWARPAHSQLPPTHEGDFTLHVALAMGHPARFVESPAMGKMAFTFNGKVTALEGRRTVEIMGLRHTPVENLGRQDFSWPEIGWIFRRDAEVGLRFPKEKEIMFYRLALYAKAANDLFLASQELEHRNSALLAMTKRANKQFKAAARQCQRAFNDVFNCGAADLRIRQLQSKIERQEYLASLEAAATATAPPRRPDNATP